MRRLAPYIEESLYQGSKWVNFEPNDELLWSQIRLSFGAFMTKLFRVGAFQGNKPGDAFYIKCDGTTAGLEANGHPPGAQSGASHYPIPRA